MVLKLHCKTEYRSSKALYEAPAASRVSKEVFNISLSLLGDATEKKPSLCMFEQVEKKNPACPTMVPRLSNSAKMDTPASAMP
ncbi:unnamed protein product [Malus baccata var. baccata]